MVHFEICCCMSRNGNCAFLLNLRQLVQRDARYDQNHSYANDIDFAYFPYLSVPLLLETIAGVNPCIFPTSLHMPLY